MDLQNSDSFALFAGHGETRSLMRSKDWSNSSLGEPDEWSPSLKTIVNLMLDSKFPMFVAWGAELGFLYNDAYSDILGDKHPCSLGEPFKNVWSEIWHDLSPLSDRALAGEATYWENFPLLMRRKGYDEQTWFTFSYSPVKNEFGQVAGVYCACHETTAYVLAERRKSFHLEMSDRLRGLSDTKSILKEASALLGRYLNVSRVVFEEIDMGREEVIFHPNYTDGTVQNLTGLFSFSNFGRGSIDELEIGHTVVQRDVSIEMQDKPKEVLDNILGLGIRSAIGVPILRNGMLTGCLFVHHHVPRKWSAEDVSVVEDVAERTWNAIERARAESKLQKNISALEQLNEVSTSVHAELELEPMLQKVTDAAVKITGAQFGAFFHNLLDGQGEFHTLYTVSGAHKEMFTHLPMPRNTLVFDTTFTGNGIKRSSDIRTDAKYGHNAPNKGMPSGHLPVRSYLAVPVLSNDKEVYGAILLGHREIGQFTQGHEDLVQGIALQAAIGITNARLYQSRESLLEAERLARSMAERESRLKEEFLNTLSHELRTPLNAITGWSELLKMRYEKNEDLFNGLAAIERNAFAQALIIDDLLDVSRIQSGKIQLANETLQMERVIESAVESLLPTIHSKQILIEKNTDAPSPKVVGDFGRLRQVVWNILSNAVKFTPNNGWIRINLGQSDGMAVLSITDSGKGITPEFLPYVFERFRQADGSITREFGGLGLGLSIVKSLVELHGGFITVSSEGIGKGASFVFRLPVTEAAELSCDSAPFKSEPGVSKARASSQPSTLEGLNILVVDDESDNLDVMSMILGNAQANVITASSMQEAMKHVKSEKIDALISDIGMPKEDGYMLIAAVRSFERSAQLPPVPAIALTALARPEDEKKAISAGFNIHVAKPVTSAKVINALLELLLASSD